MANVASNNTDTNSRPLMDRLTHAVIKETSKSLKYYIDVKRRENAFILNPNSTIYESPPVRAKFIYGNYYPDKDMKNILPSLQQKQKPIYSTTVSPEKQMCREELNFHMRSYNFSPRETSKFAELRLKSANRSTSSCSSNRDIRSRSVFKLTRHEQDQLIDDAADILASMVKSRRTLNETNLLTQQTIPMYISRNTNPSPRQIDDQTIDLRISTINQQQLPKTDKRVSDDILSKATTIMQKTKLITKGFLCDYKVSITTGNCNGASTNARIRIKLYGTNGHTNFQELSHSQTHHIPFLKDQTDVFNLQTYHVGELVGITIGHDRKDMRASWFLNKISIDDPIRNITYDIPCNAWLSIKSYDQKTLRNFPVISTISLKKKMIHSHEIQSDNSTTITEPIILSNRNEKSRKQQQHVSIDPTIIEKKFNQNELNQQQQITSPILSPTSSDTDIEGNIINQTPSTTPTPSPTLNQTHLQSVSEHETLQTKSMSDIFKRHSNDENRPPARLDTRNSSLSNSTEQLNDNNILTFFE